MTILGDLAQATAPSATSSWDEAVVHLGDPANATLAELELGYRVPAPIIDLANRLLVAAAPEVRPSRSVRQSGRAPAVFAVGEDDLVAAVAEAVADLAGQWTSVGIVAADEHYDAVAEGLRAAGITFGDGLRLGMGETVTLLTPPSAKGLEFDAVVVVEPAEVIASASDAARGTRLLYIAMTRAVQELCIVHARGLPAPLEDT
jgi:DNA helicase IV